MAALRQKPFSSAKLWELRESAVSQQNPCPLWRRILMMPLSEVTTQRERTAERELSLPTYTELGTSVFLAPDECQQLVCALNRNRIP